MKQTAFSHLPMLTGGGEEEDTCLLPVPSFRPSLLCFSPFSAMHSPSCPCYTYLLSPCFSSTSLQHVPVCHFLYCDGVERRRDSLGLFVACLRIHVCIFAQHVMDSSVPLPCLPAPSRILRPSLLGMLPCMAAAAANGKQAGGMAGQAGIVCVVWTCLPPSPPIPSAAST